VALQRPKAGGPSDADIAPQRPSTAPVKRPISGAGIGDELEANLRVDFSDRFQDTSSTCSTRASPEPFSAIAVLAQRRAKGHVSFVADKPEDKKEAGESTAFFGAFDDREVKRRSKDIDGDWRTAVPRQPWRVVSGLRHKMYDDRRARNDKFVDMVVGAQQAAEEAKAASAAH